MNIAIITPTNHFNDSLSRTIKSLSNQTQAEWDWFLINDSGNLYKNINVSEHTSNFLDNDPRVHLFDNQYGSNAGCARNFGLDKVIKRFSSCFIFFIDSGDEWNSSFIEDSINYFKSHDVNIISSGYEMQWPSGKKKYISRIGISNYHDMLKNYSTSCLSTALKISDTKLLSKIRFGKTKRVNDQPFFLDAVKHFGKVVHLPKINATYHVGHASSLSGKKFYTAIGKWRVLQEQEISIFFRLYYFFWYIARGILRYYF
ncbi:glycosyltransferase family 2 protein [Gammaproteobacteria bacterium]|nr:glycosyltransferase family 2 protein [Gammaproteobacteria bacterium]